MCICCCYFLHLSHSLPPPIFIYLAALGLSCSRWDPPCVMQDVSSQCRTFFSSVLLTLNIAAIGSEHPLLTCQYSCMVLHLRRTMESPRKLFQNTIAVVFYHNPIPRLCFSRLRGAGPQRWYTLQQTLLFILFIFFLQQTLLCLQLVGWPYTWHGCTPFILTFTLSALPPLNQFPSPMQT